MNVRCHRELKLLGLCLFIFYTIPLLSSFSFPLIHNEPCPIEMPGNMDNYQPVNITCTDVNSDGIPDIIIGFLSKGQAYLALFRGNESCYRKLPQRVDELQFSKDLPVFLPMTLIANLSVMPDFLESGDFNNDGLKDILVGEKGGNTILILAGDGAGQFFETKKITLSGNLVALTTGEINRPDGILDLGVVVEHDQHSEVLIYESPEDTLRAKPEIYPLEKIGSWVGFGLYDADTYYDCAIASGNEVVIVFGRDRRLSLYPSGQSPSIPAKTKRIDFPENVVCAIPGDFIGDTQKEIAVLTCNGDVQFINRGKGKDARGGFGSLYHFSYPEFMKKHNAGFTLKGENFSRTKLLGVRISSSPKDSLLFLEPPDNRLSILTNISAEEEVKVKDATGELKKTPEFDMKSIGFESNPLRVIPLRWNLDAMDDLIILKGETSAPVSMFLTAIQTAFVVTDSGDSSDADLSDDIFSPQTFRSALENANKLSDQDSITFSLPANTVLKPSTQYPVCDYPVVIDGTLGAGDSAEVKSAFGRPSADVQKIEINGSLLPDGSEGIVIKSDSTIANLKITQCPSLGLALIGSTGNNTITGNEITFNNGAGININSDNNTIGGLTITPGKPPGNWVAGNYGYGGQGIAIVGADGNVVIGNLIGTNQSGDAPTSNSRYGVYLQGFLNKIGTPDSGGRNVISGNAFAGISISRFSTSGNLIQNNYIGTDITGKKSIGLQTSGGMTIDTGLDTLIGGTALNAYNVIGGNDGNGISMVQGTGLSIQIQGNFVGIDETETVAIPNRYAGICVTGCDITVGGTVNGAGNIIAFNKGSGIFASGEPDASPIRIIGNRIGTNSGGTDNCGNQWDGITITKTNTQVGGGSPEEQNVICWNGVAGIEISYTGAKENLIEGNYIGTDPSGIKAQPNQVNGIYIHNGANHNTLRDNVISGNKENGVKICRSSGEAPTSFPHTNLLDGNFIGTDASGTSALSNEKNGVYIEESTSNTITSTDAKRISIISGNGWNGIEIRGVGAQVNTVEHSYIGVNNDGIMAIPNNGEGVLLTQGASGNVVGGIEEQNRNVISGNKKNGIRLSEDYELITFNNFIASNYIGTDRTGKNAIPNEENGILVEGMNNLIGGGWYRNQNVISGNKKNGIALEGYDSHGNSVEQNLIGLNFEGKFSLPNGENGILIHNATDNLIGETNWWVPGHYNVISGNKGSGVLIMGDDNYPLKKAKNTIAHNFIGVTSDWEQLSNGGHGVFINNASKNQIIFNTIACNTNNGVTITGKDEAIENLISVNSIYENGALGIDLGFDGVTHNDHLDPDDGPNHLQNFPKIDFVTSSPLGLIVSGGMESLPDTKFDIEFYWNRTIDTCGYGEGKEYIDFKQVKTDADGRCTFCFIFTKFYAYPGDYITALAIDPNNNTSEFCLGRTVSVIPHVKANVLILY